MCRLASFALGSGTGAPAAARARTRDSLTGWELDELGVDALLLVSELVTNAVVHARTEVALSLAVADGGLEVAVRDAAADLSLRPRAAVMSPDAPGSPVEGGRGLQLLELLAETWDVTPSAEGKQVWFRLPLPDAWPFRADCPCPADGPDAYCLASGRPALAVAGPWDRH